MPNRVEILKQKFTQSYGLPFSEILPASRIEKAIDELSIKYKRRLFDPFVTLWAFISQVLDADKSCHNAVSRVIAWLSTLNVEKPSTDTSAYCQARKRLPEKLLQKLFTDSGSNLETQASQENLWCGRHVKVLDTSTLSMPDTPENQQTYPQSNRQKLGCGFPTVKIGVLFSLVTGAVMNMAIDVLNTNDIKFARKLYEFLIPDDVLLGDSAFCSYADYYFIKNHGCDAVFRKHHGRHQKMQDGLILNQHDKLVQWQKPKTCPRTLIQEEFAQLPETLSVREITYKINVPGFRTTEITLITTLLDSSAFSTSALIELYGLRWHVELDLKHLKTSMGMDILRSKTPSMVHKEIYAYFLAYNLLRSLMWQAGNTYGVPPLRLSFQGTRHHLDNFISELLSVSHSPRLKEIYRTLLKVIVHKSVPNRPGRVEPRVRKRRPKAYPLMNQPRSVLRKKMVVVSS